MFELLYSLSYNCNRLNVIAICRSQDILSASVYTPTNFSNLIYVIDTSHSSHLLPPWLYIEPYKPVVFIVDTSSTVVASYFLQEKDLDTRERFSESVTRLFQKKTNSRWTMKNQNAYNLVIDDDTIGFLVVGASLNLVTSLLPIINIVNYIGLGMFAGGFLSVFLTMREKKYTAKHIFFI